MGTNSICYQGRVKVSFGGQNKATPISEVANNIIQFCGLTIRMNLY